MQPSDFTEKAPGRPIKTAQDYWAFVPQPLPPALEIDWDLANTLSEADRSLSELSGVARTLPNPHLLIAPFVRREAVLSSRIEGTTTSLAELLLDEVAEGATGRDPHDVQEVRNYVTALGYGVTRLKTLPLSLRLVRELHARLTKGARGEHATPGESRRSQNWIGSPGSTLETAVYVPPPPEELMETLGAWERFPHERNTVPDLT